MKKKIQKEFLGTVTATAKLESDCDCDVSLYW